MNKRGCLWTLLGFAMLVGLLAWWRWDWISLQANLAILESEERIQGLQVERTVASLDLAPGDRVADIGAGTGLFTRPLASVVAPSGVVYAVDLEPALLEHVARTSASAGLANVLAVLGAADDPLLPEAVDLVFLCDTLHHIEDRQSYLRTLRSYLVAGGRIAVVDFEDSSPHLTTALRYGPDELERWMAEAGYELERRFGFVEDNFFQIYRCDDCGEG